MPCAGGRSTLPAVHAAVIADFLQETVRLIQQLDQAAIAGIDPKVNIWGDPADWGT